MRDGFDKGFCILYHKLSHRRKFIRSVWLGISTAVLLLLLREPIQEPRAWAFVIGIIGFAWQAVHEYKKWQEEH